MPDGRRRKGISILVAVMDLVVPTDRAEGPGRHTGALAWEEGSCCVLETEWARSLWVRR